MKKQNFRRFRNGDVLTHKEYPEYKLRILTIDYETDSSTFQWVAGPNLSDRIIPTTAKFANYNLTTKLEKALL